MMFDHKKSTRSLASSNLELRYKRQHRQSARRTTKFQYV